MAVLSGGKPTVVLVDDHPGILTAICEIAQKDYEILAVINDGGTAITAIHTYKPDIVLLDITMPDMHGLEAARRLIKAGLDVKIVFLTVVEDIDYARAAVELGASYILKRRMYSDLAFAMKEAMAGRSFCSPIMPMERRQ